MQSLLASPTWFASPSWKEYYGESLDMPRVTCVIAAYESMLSCADSIDEPANEDDASGRAHND